MQILVESFWQLFDVPLFGARLPLAMREGKF